MDIIAQLQEEISRDGFNFEPILDDTYHKIKIPIRGRYVGSIKKTKDGSPYAIMTVISWADDFKKTYKIFDSTKVNGEAEDLEKEIWGIIEKTNETKRKSNEDAALRAEKLISLSKSYRAGHPYLSRKGIDFDFGQRYIDDFNTILIPCKDIEGKIWTAQKISCNGEKRFEKGSKKENCFFQLGEIKDKVILCEGVATGASIYRCSSIATVCALDAGNIKKVARDIRKNHPTATLYIFGDNDESGVGQRCAEAAAKEVNGFWLCPNASGKDWNDCLVEEGSEYLKKRIEEFTYRKAEKYDNKLKVVNAADRRGKVELIPDWIVDQLFPRDGSSLLSADPKAGKSTFTRFLAVCLADGKPFLGFNCKPSKVLMIAVEENERYLHNGFISLGLKNWENMYYHVASSPNDALAQAEEEIIKIKPDFVILDTLFKIVETKDENAYAETAKSIGRVQNLVNQHQVHILSVHHNNKSGARGFNKILGSAAIRGAFSYNMVIDADPKELEKDISTAMRFIMSEGREGYFFKKTALNFNRNSMEFSLGESYDAYQKEKNDAELMGELSQITDTMYKKEWIGLIPGQKQVRLSYINKLIEKGHLVEVIEGKKKLWKWNKNIITPEAQF